MLSDLHKDTQEVTEAGFELHSVDSTSFQRSSSFQVQVSLKGFRARLLRLICSGDKRQKL